MNEINNQSSQPSQTNQSAPSPRVRNKDNFFYYDCLTEAEKERYDRGSIETNNIDAEIKLLKIRVGSLVLDLSVDPAIIVRFIAMINACIKTNVKVLNRLDPDLTKYRRTLQIMFKDRLPPAGAMADPVPDVVPGSV